MYLDLLDSFRLSFDDKDESLKDISVYKEGGTTYTNDYGLSFDLPHGWSESRYLGPMAYTDEDGTMQLKVSVTSASSGDTLERWTEREEQRFADSFVETNRRIGSWHELELAGGIPARENRFSYALGDEWKSIHAVYFIKDKYKYKLELTFPKKEEGAELESLVRALTDSLSVDKDRIDTRLGFIQDENEMLNPDRTVTIRNGKYGYTVRVPETWESQDDDYGGDVSAFATYTFTGGLFEIEADDGGSFEDTVEGLEKWYKESAENDSKFRYETSDETVDGVPAKKFEIVYPKKDEPYRETVYVFANDGIVYTVTLRLSDAVRTEANVKRLSDAFQSFKLD
jgi:hypothetical protein